MSVRADPGVLCVTTSVQLHGRLGRAYFAVVRRVHPYVVRRMLRRAAGAGSRTA